MHSKKWGGILLICGTSVGTGILGIPSDTASNGLGCSLILFLICWAFSTLAALYYLEVHLWQKLPSANLLSITAYFFGLTAKRLVWLVYLALLYALMCTYLLAGSSWVIQAVAFATPFVLNKVAGMLGFIGVIGLFIFFGIRVVDHVNRWMSAGLALCYLLILSITLPHIHPLLLQQLPQQGWAIPKTLPLLITAFGYSIIIPSLSAYFAGQALLLQKTIIVGSLVTLGIYVLWEIATLGTIPLLGTYGLQTIAQNLDNGTAVANALIAMTHQKSLATVITLFALFAVITSFLGVSMALYHSLADGLGFATHGMRGLMLLVLTYVPPMLFLLIIPTGFNQILSWAGALVAFLMGILPIMMVYKGRYQLHLTGYQVPGGKILLGLVLLFFMAVIGIACW